MQTAVTNSKLATVGAGLAGLAWVAFAGVAYQPTGSAISAIGCPVKHLTGLDCPGCGSTRALGALTRLDAGAAFDHNLLVPVALVFVVMSWAVWTWSSWTERVVPALVRGPQAIVSIAIVMAAFTVARNLDAGAWLASGLSAN